MCVTNKYSFLHHNNIGEPCLKNSTQHLNANGSVLLAVCFTNFIRGKQRIDHPKHFWMEELTMTLGLENESVSMKSTLQSIGLSISSLKGLKIANLNVNNLLRHIDEVLLLLCDISFNIFFY